MVDDRVVLADAKISSKLGCRDGTFRNPGEATFNAENIEISKKMFLDGGFKAEGAEFSGTQGEPQRMTFSGLGHGGGVWGFWAG